jgi:hypothetical protein
LAVSAARYRNDDFADLAALINRYRVTGRTLPGRCWRWRFLSAPVR